MTHPPSISVIIVNFNGAHYLPACLDALHNQSYPSDRFEVIVSDNGSCDDSLNLLKNEYPWVKILDNGKNLGFASGNNVAIQATEGDFVVLLNNDTAPYSDWLVSLVDVALDDPKAGMVTGHLQLFYDQLELELQTEMFMPTEDGRELGVQVFEVNSSAPGGIVQYLDGFHGFEQNANGRKFRWTKEHAILGVPVPPGEGDWMLEIFLAASRPDNRTVPVQVSVQHSLLADLTVTGMEPQRYQIKIAAQTRSLAFPLVQNAGSIVFRDGSGRDRGTYVQNFEAFYEIDRGQYREVEEVFAGCGATLLIRRELLKDAGLLDDDFFMYYEDTDLSWRARLRGWKVLYTPKARVRHIHCGTSVEWSPLFQHLTQRNRLAMVFKNGSSRQILWIWANYFKQVKDELWDTLWAYLRRSTDGLQAYQRVRQHAGVIYQLILWLPDLFRKRRAIQATRRIKPSELETWFVE